MSSIFCQRGWHRGCSMKDCGCKCHGKTKFAVVESMTRILHAGHTIRVWRAEDAPRFEYENEDLKEAVKGVHSMDFIARALAEMPRVNAVEVLRDEDGCGLVLYPEWP